MNDFQLAKEIFLSVVKWFLIFIMLNNLIWVIVFCIGSSSITGETLQDGFNNTQEVNYGEQG